MKKVFMPLVLLPLLFLFGSCSSGGDDEDFNLRFNLTDAPMMGLKAVNVTISSVRVHQSASAADADAGWRDIPVTAAMPVDLMKLRGGVLYELCNTNLETGAYQQVRLVMVPNATGAAPYNNAITTMDGAVHPLDIPSQSPKISHSFSVGAGTKTDVTLDFDAARSCRQRGNGTWFMEPWITANSTTH